MANRHRLRTTDFQPGPKRGSWVDTRPRTAEMARKHRHTISRGANPFHEGIEEAKRSGMSNSKRVAVGLAKNGTPHHEAVAVDHRTQTQEKERERIEARFRRLHRKIDPTLA